MNPNALYKDTLYFNNDMSSMKKGPQITNQQEMRHTASKKYLVQNTSLKVIELVACLY